MYSTANLSDRELKEQGNRLFSLRKYEDAINCYTKAIVSSYSTGGKELNEFDSFNLSDQESWYCTLFYK